MKDKNLLVLKAVFGALVGVFALIISGFFIPAVGESLKGSSFLILWFAFFLLGMTLIFLVRREKVKGKLRSFLLLTGASAAGFLVSAFLHNFLYALAIISRPIYILSKLMEVFHVAFFVMATIVCPITFVIGVIGSVVKLIKRLFF